MPTVLEVVYPTLLAVGCPLYDYFIDWPRFLGRLHKNPHHARLREYRAAIVLQWLLVAVTSCFGGAGTHRGWDLASMLLITTGGYLF